MIRANHKIVLTKLRNIGIQGTELNWFKDYLYNRKQYVFLNGTASSLLTVKTGVLQGSIFGPLLFLIFINDLPNSFCLLTLLFADDTTLLYSHSDIHELISIVNREFHKVVQFFRTHKLSLHPLKTKFMVFSNSQIVKNMNIELFIDCNNNEENDLSKCSPISRVLSTDDLPAVRFLGVYFDPSLNFQYHTKIIISKLSKALYILRSSKNLLTLKSLKSVYYALFHCNLIFCLPIWSCAASKLISNLHTLQKKAIRVVNGSKYNSHTETIFKSLGILPLNSLIKFFNLQFMQNYVQGFLPTTFNTVWLTNEERRQEEVYRTLCNNNQLFIPFTRLAKLSKHPLIIFPKTWVEFSNVDIKIIRNKIEFKIKLKKYLLGELSDTIICNRLLCPFCHLNAYVYIIQFC